MKNVNISNYKQLKSILFNFFFVLLTVTGFAQTNPTPQNLPYSQNFNSFTGSTTTYPSGLQGWTVAGSLSTSYATTAPNGDFALAGGTNATSTAGVYDMNGKIGLLCTGSTLRAICLALNTSGSSGINVSFDAATQAQINGGRINEIGLQYRVGTSGAFTNIALSTYANNATSTINSGTAASNSLNVALTLPAACNNQSIVQLRWFIRDVSGSGNRPSFSIDNISVTSPNTSTVTITAQDPNTPTAVNWAIGSTQNQFYWAGISPAGASATLNSVSANMIGNYLSSDIASSGFKLYYSSDFTFVPTGDVLLSSQSSTTGNGETVTWNGFSQTITQSTTGYIYATADLTSTATAGNTLAGSFTSNTNVVFSPTVSYSGSNTYGSTTVKTFAALPTNPGTFNLSCASEAKININMNAPTTGTVLVFANAGGSFTTPTGAGSGFTGANSNYSSAANYPAVGGKLVYSGTGSNFSITGTIANQNYNFIAYSYSGSNWSSGTAVVNATTTTQPITATVVTPSSGQLQLSWTNPNANACFNNVIVIARQGSAVESAVSKTNFDGLVSDADFTGANTIWPSNSNSNDVFDLTSTLIGSDNTNYFIYKGTSNSVTLTGLTNGIPYFFRIFTVDGIGAAARWSAAVDANGTPDQPGYYWNGGSISNLPANGGTGTWGTTSAWRQPGPTGSQATWSDNNNAIFNGNAGVVTLDANRVATAYLFNTTGYTLQTTSSTGVNLTGPTALANNIELVLAPNFPSTTFGTIGVSSINGTGSASVTIFGNPASSIENARVNLAVANSTISVPTNIATATGIGMAGYVSTATGAVINGNITNNSALRTMIGSTSGNDLTINGVISGSAGLQISAGASGGAGKIIFNSVNTYSGATVFNAANSGTISLGVNDAFPNTTNLTMAFSSSNGGILDLNSFNQTVGNISNGVGGGSITNNGSSSNSTLTITQSTAGSFSRPITDGSTKKTAINKSGNNLLILNGSGYTFSGGLFINNGELRYNPTSSPVTQSSCPVTLNGGKLGTSSINAGSVINFSTLTVSDNSIIDLSSVNAHTLNFANSSLVSWTASKTLTITGWQGTYSTSIGSPGTVGKIFVGNSASGLLNTQLFQITFFDGSLYYAANLLSTGELVPYLCVPPVISFANNNSPLCPGNTLNLTSSATGTISPVYSWAGPNSFTSAIQNPTIGSITGSAAGIYTVTATNACGIVTLTTTPVVINPTVAPSATITASGNNFCSTSVITVTFNASVTNGGSSPSYQWQLNGVNVGTSASSYTNNSLVNNDKVVCILTSNAVCPNPASVNSNTITMTVMSTPTILAMPSVTVCGGKTVAAINFTTVPSGQNTSWFNTNTGIGLGNSGVGSISSFTSALVSSTQVGAIQVTPFTGSCFGTPTIFNITVNGPQSSSVWTGAVSSSFFDSDNWTNCVCNSITDATIAAVISPSFNPIITATADVKNLTIDPSASLSIATNQTLNVNGDWINNGSFDEQAGLVNLTGTTTAQSIAGTSTTSFYNLTLNNSFGSNISSPVNVRGTLQLSAGTLNTNNQLTLIADATGSGRIGPINSGADITNDVTVQQYAQPGATGWALLGSPVLSGLTMADWNDNFVITCLSCPDGSVVSSSPFTSIYSYDETAVGNYSASAKYIPITNITDPISHTMGYWVYLGNSYPNTSGIMFNTQGNIAKSNCSSCTGTVTIPLSYTNNGNISDDGWNLISNPLPSPISWTALLNGNSNVDDAIYAYNADQNSGTGGIVSYVNGVASTTIGGINDTIPMCQGFYVHATGNASLLAGENVKVHSNTPFLKTVNTNVTKPLVRLIMTGMLGYSDQTTLYFENGATVNFDKSYDAFKVITDGSIPYLATVTDSSLTDISGLPDLNYNNVSEAVQAITPVTSTFTFSMYQENFPTGICVELFDNYTGITTNILNSTYTCTLYDTTTWNRFTINFKTQPLAGTTAVNSPACTDPNSGSIIATGNTGGPWNYVWKNSSNVILKTSLNLNVADTLTQLTGGNFFVSINSAGTCNTFTQSIAVNPVILPSSQFIMDNDTVYLSQNAVTNFTNNSINAINYSWNFGDNSPGSSLQNPSYAYQSSGIYTVTLMSTSASLCNSISAQTVVVLNAPVGIYESDISNTIIIENKDYKIYALRFDLVLEDNVELVITDMKGTLMEKSIKHKITKDLVAVDLTNYASGLYMLNVKTEKNGQRVFKIIKN